MRTRVVHTATHEQVSRTVHTTHERVSRIRVVVGIPIAIVSLVLAVLALIAGMSPGFMEDYHILLLNTSTLGHIPAPIMGSDPSPTSCGPFGGSLSKICASATEAVGSAVSSGLAELSNIENEVADRVAKELGVQQWYSLHVMDICKGTFTPNATIAGAGYHVTSCTKLSDFNISALLDHELDALHLTLARLNTADLQNELDRIPSLFQGLKCLYISAVVASGLSLLLCIALSFRPCVVVSWANAVVTLIGSVVLLIGNTFIVVVVGGDLADKANSFGKHIGFSVSVGQKFVAITWTASAMMAVMGGYWTYKSRHLVREIRKVVPQVQRWGADF